MGTHGCPSALPRSPGPAALSGPADVKGAAVGVYGGVGRRGGDHLDSIGWALAAHRGLASLADTGSWTDDHRTATRAVGRSTTLLGRGGGHGRRRGPRGRA